MTARAPKQLARAEFNLAIRDVALQCLPGSMTRALFRFAGMSIRTAVAIPAARRFY